MYFDDYSIVSFAENITDKVVITLNIAEFTTSDGLYLPDGSTIERNLPPQIDPEYAEILESIGQYSSYIFLGLMLVNGGLNSSVSDLDYTALMDAIEGPQMNSFVPGMDVTMPPDANLMCAQIKDAASLEPSDVLSPNGGPSVLENMWGEVPDTGPLNDKLATIGYDTMHPISEINAVSWEFFSCVGVLVAIGGMALYGSKKESYLGQLISKHAGNFILWGTIINLISVNFLPVLTSTFISSVGMQWEDLDNSVVASNIWTLFMLSAWIVCPIMLVLIFVRNRQAVGKLNDQIELKDGSTQSLIKRDPMKVGWKKDWCNFEKQLLGMVTDKANDALKNV